VCFHRLGETVDAFAFSAGFPGPVERWKQHPCQNGDDGNYYEKFNQSKFIMLFHFSELLCWLDRFLHDVPPSFKLIIPERKEKVNFFDTIN